MEDAIGHSISELVEKADKDHTHDEYLTEHQDISGKADKNHTHSGMVTSSTINKIEFVTSYPTTMEPDVLYILISEN